MLNYCMDDNKRVRLITLYVVFVVIAIIFAAYLMVQTRLDFQFTSANFAQITAPENYSTDLSKLNYVENNFGFLSYNTVKTSSAIEIGGGALFANISVNLNSIPVDSIARVCFGQELISDANIPYDPLICEVYTAVGGGQQYNWDFNPESPILMKEGRYKCYLEVLVPERNKDDIVDLSGDCSVNLSPLTSALRAWTSVFMGNEESLNFGPQLVSTNYTSTSDASVVGLSFSSAGDPDLDNQKFTDICVATSGGSRCITEDINGNQNRFVIFEDSLEIKSGERLTATCRTRSGAVGVCDMFVVLEDFGRNI